MNCRPTVLTVALSTAFALALEPAPARADVLHPTTVTYELTSDSDIPPALKTETEPQVTFAMVPPNTIAPPNLPPDKNGVVKQGSPLTILPSTSGFDQAHGVIVSGQEDAKNPDGTAKQLFGMSFFTQTMPEGLLSAAHGGHLDFTLRVDSTLPPPVFTLDPSSRIQGVHLSLLTMPTTLPTPAPVTPPAKQTATPPTTTPPPTTVVSATHSVGQASVPEPWSVAVWSALAGGGLLRARSFRRRAV